MGPPKKKPSQSRMTPKVRVEVVKVEKNRLHQDTEIQNPKIGIGIVRASPEIGASKKKEEIDSKTERGKSKDKGGENGPPQSRVKVTPNPEESSKKRKGDRSISPSEDTDRKHKRDKSEPSSPPGKKDRKPDRKREREEETSNTEKKKRSLTDPDPIEVAKHVQNGETDR